MRVLIVGGNAAGMSAASKLRRLDNEAEIIVFERGNEVSYGSCGLPYFISGISNDENMLRVRALKEFEDKYNIEVRMNEEVTALDSSEKYLSVKNKYGEIYTEYYDKLVISTGASSVFPPFPGKDLDNIFTLKSIEDGKRIKAVAESEEIKNVTIVGSGFIGMELAESFLALNKNVRIIEMLPHVMGNYEPEISRVLEDKLRAYGVHLCLGEAVKSFEGDNKIQTITTDKNSYETDMAIIAIGVSPNTKFLKDNEGFEFLKNGAIIVNNKMETGVSHVYAGGDCASVFNEITKQNTYIALATNANKQGRIIGSNLAGGNVTLPGRIGTSALKFNELEVAKTGVGLNEAVAAGYNAGFSLVETQIVPPYYSNQSSILIKIIYDKDTNKLLGACMAGDKGTAIRIDIFATAITGGMTVNDISTLDLAYAPPFSLAWDAVQVAANATK